MISVPYQVVQKMVSRSMVRNPLPLLQEEEQEDLPAPKIQKVMGRGASSKDSAAKNNLGDGIVGDGDKYDREEPNTILKRKRLGHVEDKPIPE